jgi:hypothetical protein
MKKTVNTWKDNNPEYEYRYMDDEEAGEFIKLEYGDEVYSFFINAPVGVMRGDMWRYLIIYKYGGVYTDLDTECIKPILTWMIEDKDFIVCPEHQDHFCQWTFAASQGNQIIKTVIDLMIERLKVADYSMKHFVHYLTGPGMWTSGICKHLGIPNSDPYGRAHYQENSSGLTIDMADFNISDLAKHNKFYCYSGEDWRIFHHIAVRHLYGSQNWNEGYVKWIEDPLVKGENNEA